MPTRDKCYTRRIHETLTVDNKQVLNINLSYLLSQFAPILTFTPTRLKNFVKMEYFPPLNFSWENLTCFCSSEKASGPNGTGAAYRGRLGDFIDVMTLPSWMGPEGG